MPYGTIKVDNVTFTNAGVDQNVTVSGLYAATTSNLNVTGTISGSVVIGSTTVSGATISGITFTGVTANFATGAFSSSATAASFIPTASGIPANGLYLPAANTVGISTGGSGRLFVDASGNVGAGTSSPASRLHVDDGIITAGRYGNLGALVLRRANGTAASPTQITSSASIAGVYARGLNELGAYNGIASIGFGSDGAITSTSSPGYFVVETTPSSSTSSQERLRITSDGKVGVGTSSPSELLHVVGSGTTTIRVATSDTSGAAVGRFRAVYPGGGGGATSAVDLRAGDGYGYLLAENNVPLLFGTNNAERLRITAGGNVGIGTTSPGTLLQCYGGASGADTRATIGNAANSVQIGVDGGNAGLIAVSQAQPLAFYINSSERARIDSSGRLLVGTSSGTNNIRLDQKIAVVSTGGNFAGAALTSYGGTSASVRPVLDFNRSRGTTDGSMTAVAADDFLGTIVFRGSDGTQFVDGAFIQALVDGGVSTNDLPTRLVFSTTADGASSPTERMRITNDGKLYFACTADPSSTIKGGAYIGSAASPYFSSSAGTSTSSYAHFYFINGNGTVGSISTSGSATAYNTSSDYRLKENVTVVTDGITRLQQLKPSRFNFIVDPTKTVDGFIAHEVQEVVPEAITGEKDAEDADGNPIYQGIDQSKLVPLLTAALQEAVAKIESLEARLTAAGI